MPPYGSGLRNGFAYTSHLPAYFQVNAARRTASTPLFGGTKAPFPVINLFDRPYQLRDGTGIGVGAPQYTQRRNYYLALSQRF
ncbi:hypothetical protein AWV79_26910 [Cupriavidus sp. UYMMa02A]|nr:hypothetical protein AWV79_26910 [Cupriavidus sp. UYMMa02A]